MLRVLFLILAVLSSVAFAQTEDNTPKPPEARIFDEFEKETNGGVKKRTLAFSTELNNDPTAPGYIINYGTDREIAAREKQIRNAISFFKYDATRITMVRGGPRGILKTEFWIVPAGAKVPTLKSEGTNERAETRISVKLEEFQNLTDGYVKIKIHRFFKELRNRSTSKGYIINFGNDREIARRESQIKDAINFFKYDPSKVT